MVQLVRTNTLLMAEGSGDIITDTVEQVIGGCFGVVLLFVVVTLAIGIRMSQLLFQ